MKLKWEIIWSGGLPHLSGLPHCTWGPPWESAVFYSIRKLDTKSRFPNLTPMWVNNRFSTQKQGFQCSLSFVNWILSCSWSRHTVIFSKLISEPACSSQVDLHWASPQLPWGMLRICGPFFRIYLCLSRDFVNQHVFLLLDLHWDSPKLPWGMQRICGPFVFQTIIMPFKRLFVLWHSLIIDLRILFKFIFLYL